MYSEDELLPISALQHLAFCERQWGLIHLEGAWRENRLTAEGRVLHERTHGSPGEARRDVRIARGLRLRSLALGLTGKADVVEFHRLGNTPTESAPSTTAPAGLALDGVAGLWRPIPVEYKRGRPKPDRCDEVQLCAQALCLEEMLGVQVPSGAIFYGLPRRRSQFELETELRGETTALAQRLHELTRASRTPPAQYSRRCRNCSLVSLCLPGAAGKSARRYLNDALARAKEAEL